MSDLHLERFKGKKRAFYNLFEPLFLRLFLLVTVIIGQNEIGKSFALLKNFF